MTKVTVDPGACGFTCKIEVEQTEKYKATVHLDSQCKQIRRFAMEVFMVDFMEIMRGPLGQNAVGQSGARCKLHPSCPVPSALIKAVEAELGMAVKKNVTFTFDE